MAGLELGGAPQAHRTSAHDQHAYRRHRGWRRRAAGSTHGATPGVAACSPPAATALFPALALSLKQPLDELLGTEAQVWLQPLLERAQHGAAQQGVCACELKQTIPALDNLVRVGL